MVIISIQVHLVDVPPCVDIVSVWIEHDKNVNLGVLKDIDGFFVSFSPSVDVPFCRQPCQCCPKVFIAVMATINVDHLLCRTVFFGFHGPVRKANYPECLTKFRFSSACHVNDVGIGICPLIDLHGQGGPGEVNVVVNGFSGPCFLLNWVILSTCDWNAGEQHADHKSHCYSHVSPSLRRIKNTCIVGESHQSEVKALGLATFSPSRVQILGPSVL